MPATLSEAISNKDNSNAAAASSKQLLELAKQKEQETLRYGALYPSDEHILEYQESLGVSAAQQSGQTGQTESESAARQIARQSITSRFSKLGVFGKFIAKVIDIFGSIFKTGRVFSSPYISVWDAALQRTVYMSAWGMRGKGASLRRRRL